MNTQKTDLIVQTPIPPITQFDAYTKTVNQLPILDEDTEKKLALDVFENNDTNAARVLATSHLRLPVKVAYEHKGYGIPLEDLVQEGNIGLLKAIRKFDPHMNVRLSVLALAWIRAEIRSYILKNWKNVRIATNKKLRHLFFTFRKEKQILENAGISGMEINKLLSNKLGISEKDLMDFENRITSEISIDAPLREQSENKNLTLADTLPCPNNNIEQLIDQNNKSILQEKLNEAIFSLPERTRKILIERRINEPHKSLQEISKEMGISVGRVHQIEEQAMKQLKIILSKNLLQNNNKTLTLKK